MNYRILFCGTIVMYCMTAASNVDAKTNVDIDALTPITQGGSTAILPGTHMQRNGTIVAPTMQSAANFAVQNMLGGSLKGKHEIGSNVYQIKTGSGIGYVSKAQATYGTYKNLTATLISKRAAYMRAYSKTITNLIQFFKQTAINCETKSTNTLMAATTGNVNGNASGASINNMERCMGGVAGSLNGFVIYSLNDNAKEDRVTIAIVTSPKTQEAVDRVGLSVIKTNNVHSAWLSVLSQLETGAIPPVGARLIEDPKTHQSFVIGFGSAIIRPNANPFIAHHLLQGAAMQAKMQSQAALIGFLRGDQSYWNGGYNNKTREGARNFTPSSVRAFRSPADRLARVGRELAGLVAHIQKGDYSGAIATASDDIDHKQKAGGIAIHNAQNEFLNTLKETSAYSNVERGVLPAGVTSRTFVGSSGHWAIALSIYSPATTRKVEQSYDQMRAQPNSAATPNVQNRIVPTTGGMSPTAKNPRGPSGQVTPAGDL